MRDLPNIRAEKFRLVNYSSKADGNNGAFAVRCNVSGHSVPLTVIVSDGLDWDHVSVSAPERCPTWGEMCFIKELFFDDSEVVYQLHPVKHDHISNHPYCLHLWRPRYEDVPTPPIELVGVPGVVDGVVSDRTVYSGFLGSLDPETRKRAIEAYGRPLD